MIVTKGARFRPWKFSPVCSKNYRIKKTEGIWRHDKMKIENEKNKTLYIQISSALLRTVVRIIGGLKAETAKLCITPTRINIIAFDNAMVAMMFLTLEQSIFEKFQAAQFEIDVDLNRLKEIVNLARTDDLITIKFDYKNNQLVINLGNLETRMGILDFNEGLNAPPSLLNQSGQIVLHVDELKRGIAAAEFVAESVSLSIDPEKFELKAEDNANSAHLTLSKKDLVEHESNAIHKNTFSTYHLSNIINVLNGEYCIRLCFGNGTHLQLDYDFSEKGHLTYVLMPRVES